MHFTTQAGFLTDIPTIYHPHDLQHLHLPQFFDYYSRLYREITYRALCRQARLVPVVANWGKGDLVEQYHLPEDKIAVIPFAPVVEAYRAPTEADASATRRKYQLPETFVFYPAQTWPHKNHCRLLEALARLRDRGLKVPLVCSGHRNTHFRVIERCLRELALGEQVRFLGFVDPIELQCLYALCRAVIIPTRFEAASGPMWEAFLAGRAVACSNVTSLPEQAGDAALIFAPDDVEAMGRAIQQLWTDGALRQTLQRRGRERIAELSWERTARTFRAHYRRLAGRRLTEDDHRLLAASAGKATRPVPPFTHELQSVLGDSNLCSG
jgi:glycosyltransferase involved in cell wall biosynthesis